MNIMNKANTHGGRMWTPEYQQELERLKQQEELNQIDELKEDPDNIRYYRPDAMGFTQAEY